MLVVDQNHRYVIREKLRKRKKYTNFKKAISLESIVSNETQINNPIHVEAEVDGEILHRKRNKWTCLLCD